MVFKFLLRILLLVVGLTPEAFAQYRGALVLANKDYGVNEHLNDSIFKDYNDMITFLQSSGFEVFGLANGKKKDMQQAIKNFERTLAKKKGVGLVYYSGHGLLEKGVDYLLPIEGPLFDPRNLDYNDPTVIKKNSISVESLVRGLHRTGNSFNIIIMDKCRINGSYFDTGPITILNKGLKSASGYHATRAINWTKFLKPYKNTVVAFSSSSGQISRAGRAGTADYSVYTEELLAALNTPGLSMNEIFKLVSLKIASKSEGKQIPLTYSSYKGDFYFSPQEGK